MSENSPNAADRGANSTYWGMLWNVLLGALAIAVGGLYVYVWQCGFSADYAMIGLIAKRILTTGEQFIFVPRVGYQGLLYEANLVAFMFRTFGINAYTLNFAPFATFLAFCLVYYGAVRAWHGSANAKLATLFLIVSTPTFYTQILRTQPNYGETFLMGSALFWMYRRLLDRSIFVTSSTERKSFPWALLFFFGVIAGFGVYTYGQILYFIGAIGAHFTLMVIRNDHPKWSSKIKVLLCSLVGYLAFSLICFLTSFDQIVIGHIKLRYMPIALITSSIALIGLTTLLSSAALHWKNKAVWLPPLLLSSLGGLVGLSPKFYYSYVLKGPSMSRLASAGELPDILNRLHWLFQAKGIYFGDQVGPWLGWFAFLGVMTFIAFFTVNSGKKIYTYLLSPTSSTNSDILSISPFFLLIGVVLFGYLTSGAAGDAGSARYALVILLSISVSYAVVATPGPPSCRGGRGLKVSLLGALGLILAVNSIELGKSLETGITKNPFGPVIQYMKKNGLSYAFADYWYSYSIAYLTNEDIILEPLYSSYLPFYLEKVKAENRLAYVDSKPYKIGLQDINLGQIITLPGGKYSVKDKASFEEIDVFTLDRML